MNHNLQNKELSELHDEILQKVEKYCQVLQKHPVQFIPDETVIPYAGRIFDEKEMQNLVDSALEFWLTCGRYTKKFETMFSEYLGVSHVLLVNSGSSANLIAFSTLTSPLLGERRVQRGDEIITVAAAFPTTVAPIIQYGAVPVFVDVELETANIDVSMLEKALSSRTKAVMLAHTLGNPFNIRVVKAFCAEHHLWLIEDNCDALGSRYAGKYTGTWGDIGTSSFYPAHHLTMGEGGAVYMNDSCLYKIALSLRDWGRECWCQPGNDNSCGCRFTKQYGSLPPGYDHKYVYSHFGFNLKATDMQAAIGCAQLGKLDEFIKKRKENFNDLKEILQNLFQLKIIQSYPEAEPSWFGMLMVVQPCAEFSRNQLSIELENHKIQTRNLFAGNLLRHPCFTGLVEGKDYRVVGKLVNTDILMENAVWVGVYPGMSKEKLLFIGQTIKNFCAGKV